MNLQKVKKLHILRFNGNFIPKVRLSSTVKVGSLLGIGDYFRVLQEIPLGVIDDILVDDGMFVTSGTEIAVSLDLFKKKIFVADTDGLVRITKESLQIVDIEANHKYYSTVSGKVEFAREDKIKIRASFYKYWLFASLGSFVRGVLYFVDIKKPIVTTKDLTKEIKGKIVVIPSFLTKRLIIKAIQLGAIGVIGASIDYAEFNSLTNIIKYINLGVLVGFGNVQFPANLFSFFKEYHNYYLEADFSREFLYMPVREIFASKIYTFVFSGLNWATNVLLENIDENNFVKVKTIGKVVKDLKVKSGEVFVS